MGALSVQPASRFGWPGATLRYRVHAEHSDSIVLPWQAPPNVHARLTRLRRDGQAAEGVVEVTFPSGTAGFACVRVPVAARDLSGRIAQEHVEVITATRSSVLGMAAAGVFGAMLATVGLGSGGPVGVTIGVLGVAVAGLGAGSLTAVLWARFMGVPWHFT